MSRSGRIGRKQVMDWYMGGAPRPRNKGADAGWVEIELPLYGQWALFGWAVLRNRVECGSSPRSPLREHDRAASSTGFPTPWLSRRGQDHARQEIGGGACRHSLHP